MARALVATGEYRTAHAVLGGLVAGDATPQVLVEFAVLAQRMGDPAASLALLDRAAAESPLPTAAAYLRATMQVFCGRIDDAEASIEGVLRTAPGFARAHWTLSKLRHWTPERQHVARLQRAISMAKTHDEQAYLNFALFKELDDLDDTEAAWAALERGCRARRAQVEYSAPRESDLFARIASASPTGTARDTDAEGPQPIFVVGLPRTGSTLVERILGAHPDVANAGELHDFPLHVLWACDHVAHDLIDEEIVVRMAGIDASALGHRYLDNAAWRARGRRWFTDKLPRNVLHAGPIHQALPGARIVHVVRDPMDACFSNLKELFGAAYPHSYTMHEMAAHHRNLAGLSRHWRTMLADRWIDVSYEAVVEDPASALAGTFAACGLKWHDGYARSNGRAGPIATASTVQAREPLHRGRIGQWRRYERQLTPLADLLAAG